MTVIKFSSKITGFFLFFFCLNSFAQQKTENVFLITTDGFRWQELFGGADSSLIFDPTFTTDSAKTTAKFWAQTPAERRTKLLPFFWNTFATKGQIYGNRWQNSKVNVMNPFWFSYPGYNEILTGYADDMISSNSKIYNENQNVLEFLNTQPNLKGKVAAYCTWDVFPFIINDRRSGIEVNAGVQEVVKNPNERESILNQIQQDIPSLASNRFDFITYYLAKEYVKKNHPKVMFISFDETDEFGHEAKYREYLYAANNFDKFLADLWAYCQSDPQYKDKTTFILTTDHGRGDKNKKQWTSHGQRVQDCYQIWFAAMGPDTKPLGEMANTDQLYQNQIAATVAKLMGYTLESASKTEIKPVGKPIESVLK